MFTKPLISPAAIRTTAQAWSGPHLVTDESSLNVYYFDAAPGPMRDGPLTLPQTLTVRPPAKPTPQNTPSEWGSTAAHTLGELTVYRT